MLKYIIIIYIAGARSGSSAVHRRRGACGQAVPGAVNAGALGRRARERFRAAVRRGLRAGHATSALPTRPRLRGGGHAARCLRDHVGRVRGFHQIASDLRLSRE